LPSFFGTTYDVEVMYSTMKFIKSKFRSQLTNQHLVELMRSSISHYQPDYEKFISTRQSHKPSSSKDVMDVDI